MSHPKRTKPKETITNVLFTLGLVAVLLFLTQFRPLQVLDAQVKDFVARQGWLLPAAIAIASLGAAMLVGAQFLPEPRRKSSPSDAALDGAAVPMEFREERQRFERSFEMSASVPEVQEAWRRRSWRYSRRWRIFFVMMLGALLMVLGMVALAAVLAPFWLTLLMLVILLYFGTRMVWEFWIR